MRNKIKSILEAINEQRLHVRSDNIPVTEKQVWDAIFRNPQVFVWESGLIHLLM